MAKRVLKPRKGRLLIAEPFMKDPYFKRSVVLLADYNEEGSFGFILNKAIELEVINAINDFPDYKGELYLGGPVSTDQLFYIHTLGNKISKSVEIIPGLWWGGDFKKVKMLIKKEAIKPEELRFFVGYASWEAQQLDIELKEHSWILTDPQIDVIMNPTTENLWSQVIRSLGGEYAQMANYPEDPQLN